MLRKVLCRILTVCLLVSITYPSVALAADGAYVVFKDGREAKLRDGYKELMAAMRELKRSTNEAFVVEINLDGNSFFINVSELAVVCKEPCRSFQMIQKKN